MTVHKVGSRLYTCDKPKCHQSLLTHGDTDITFSHQWTTRIAGDVTTHYCPTHSPPTALPSAHLADGSCCKHGMEPPQ